MVMMMTMRPWYERWRYLRYDQGSIVTLGILFSSRTIPQDREISVAVRDISMCVQCQVDFLDIVKYCLFCLLVPHLSLSTSLPHTPPRALCPTLKIPYRNHKANNQTPKFPPRLHPHTAISPNPTPIPSHKPCTPTAHIPSTPTASSCRSGVLLGICESLAGT